MDYFETAAARHSYRGAYLPAPVPREHLIKILEAGCQAPSGCNMQTTSFVAVDDPEVLKQLHALLRKPLGITAPAMICVLTQALPAYHSRLFHVQDYSAAIENLLLAITALGYASCWVEGYVTDPEGLGKQMSQVLGVPEEYEMVAYLPVGIPAEPLRQVPKKPLAERAWFNGFGNEIKS